MFGKSAANSNKKLNDCTCPTLTFLRTSPAECRRIIDCTKIGHVAVPDKNGL